MKNILMTGGSSGLGRALALKFDSQGNRVVVVARNPERLLQLQTERPSIHAIQGDVSDQWSIHRIFAEAVSLVGDIDILINNASSLGPSSLSLMLDTECEDFSAALETNVLGAFRLTKLVLPSMILKGGGVVVNISSDAAIQNYASWGAYSVSKSALDHMTRIFQEEVPNVRFLAVDPGDMRTDLHLKAVPDADLSSLHDPADSAALLISLVQSNVHGAEHRGLR